MSAREGALHPEFPIDSTAKVGHGTLRSAKPRLASCDCECSKGGGHSLTESLFFAVAGGQRETGHNIRPRAGIFLHSRRRA